MLKFPKFKPEQPKFESIYTSNLCSFYQVDGQLYSIGDKQSGQLGFSKLDRMMTRPIPIQIPINRAQIVQVSCSDIHVLALEANGAVFSWGRNANCVLGVKGNKGRIGEKVLEPEPVAVLKQAKVVYVSACNSASFALNFRGRAFVWGK